MKVRVWGRSRKGRSPYRITGEATNRDGCPFKLAVAEDGEEFAISPSGGMFYYEEDKDGENEK